MAKTRKNAEVVLRLAAQRIAGRIVPMRSERVLLDTDLAALYGVTTGALNRAVKRNIERFPKDFMFQLTPDEVTNLKCQSGISSSDHGGRRRSRPYAFTEQGVAMLSSVLRSRRAVLVNVEIMRAFVALRREAGRYEALGSKLGELECANKVRGEDIQMIFAALRQLEETTSWAYPEGRRLIGFQPKPGVVKTEAAGAFPRGDLKKQLTREKAKEELALLKGCSLEVPE